MNQKMNLNLLEKIILILAVLCIFLIIITLSSCALLQPAGSWFKPKPESTNIIPAGNQLWHTVKKSNWATTIAIPIIALGAVAAFNGMVKLGMSAAIFGCVNLFMALATARFAMWMAVFGLIGSVVTVGASILIKNKAFVEIIKGVQKGKNTGHQFIAGQPFISKNFLNKQLDKQSKPTQKLVQNVKSKLKLQGKI